MPYNLNSKNLPSYVEKLSDKNKKKWINIFNTAYTEYGEKKAFLMANSWLKKNIKSKTVTAKTTQSVEKLTFFVDDSEKVLIKRTDDGQDYIDFVLTDNKPDSEGVTYSEDLIQKWADQINSGDILIGDYDHSEYDKLIMSGLSPDEVMKRLKTKPGIAKTVKAIVDKGRLWVRAMIDKRYKKMIQTKSKGVSLEATLIRDTDTNSIVDGTLGGFTFAMDAIPVNPRAVIA